ncbi:MAG: family 10 glycosylhydrolase [Phormidium sp. BM_Day4_Bin.17]|nr:family 10 glycosylhydrolase [Phormidium sp. BM_Day4_Bin.17]UCJ13831.1 MAG: family 10 glycosylhydrolase [Phormidium sp. PBR-2020]
MAKSKQNSKGCGCGCASIPFSVMFLILAGGIWLFTQRDNLDISRVLPSGLTVEVPVLGSIQITEPSPTPSPISETAPPQASPQPLPPPDAPVASPPSPETPWESKPIRGMYFSRYQVTNNASETMIRERVRYYRDRGINTLIHGVFGNGCAMYRSEVMQAKLGYDSCPNEFEDQWLEWLIDEAHQHDMEVHAYFEKGIKLDENSPMFDKAVERGWIVPGVDRTHPGVDHYVLNVGIPEVARFFTDIVVEFVEKYPEIDAVQWDDYLGYHAELPGQVDRTPKLTNFVQTMIQEMREANPNVSFDICHHNPYWAKQYFAADWESWDIDRAFIQVYGDENFEDEMGYVIANDGISITERQLHRLEALVNNPEIDNLLFFPLSGQPQEMAEDIHELVQEL